MYINIESSASEQQQQKKNNERCYFKLPELEEHN